MRYHHLGPHTFISQQPHARHREWLTQFTPRQRHQLIEEDARARWQVFGVMIGAMLFGLGMLVGVLLLVL